MVRGKGHIGLFAPHSLVGTFPVLSHIDDCIQTRMAVLGNLWTATRS